LRYRYQVLSLINKLCFEKLDPYSLKHMLLKRPDEPSDQQESVQASEPATDETGSWVAEVILETRWQRGERAARARFADEAQARAWVTSTLDRLRVHGQSLGGEDAACYLAEVSVLPTGLVCTAYLLDGAGPIDWDEWEE
jgi:hypothetical protein